MKRILLFLILGMFPFVFAACDIECIVDTDCKECIETCSSGHCTSNGMIKCDNMGGEGRCVTEFEECYCSTQCTPCSQDCAGESDRCIDTGNKICPATGTCVPSSSSCNKTEDQKCATSCVIPAHCRFDSNGKFTGCSTPAKKCPDGSVVFEGQKCPTDTSNSCKGKCAPCTQTCEYGQCKSSTFKLCGDLCIHKESQCPT